MTRPLRGYFRCGDLTAQPAEEFSRVKIIGSEQGLSPALTPFAQRLDDGAEILAGRRQLVEMGLAAGFRLDMGDARPLKLLGTLSQHCAGYRGCCIEQLSA